MFGSGLTILSLTSALAVSQVQASLSSAYCAVWVEPIEWPKLTYFRTTNRVTVPADQAKSDEGYLYKPDNFEKQSSIRVKTEVLDQNWVYYILQFENLVGAKTTGQIAWWLDLSHNPLMVLSIEIDPMAAQVYCAKVNIGFSLAPELTTIEMYTK